MSKHTNKEFSELCKCETKYLSVYIKRGKVIVDENGEIDDTNPFNRAFMEKCLLRPKMPSAHGAETTSVTEQPQVAKPKKEPKQVTMEFGELTERTLAKLEQDQRKKELEIEKLRRENDLLRRKEEKMMGLLLPTDLVTSMCKRIVHTYGKKFRGSLDNISGLWGKKFKLNRNEVVELRKAMLDELNRADKEAKDELHEEVDNLVQEFSTNGTI